MTVARKRIHFVTTAVHRADDYVITTTRDYNVEIQYGQVRFTIGRIYGGGNQWNALPVGATAWTNWHRTRKAALAALETRENWTLS